MHSNFTGNIKYLVGADAEGYTQGGTISIRAINSVKMTNTNIFECDIEEVGSAIFRYYDHLSCNEAYQYIDSIIERLKKV